MAWAKEQSAPKANWLTGWEDLDEGQREVDMRIGEAVAAAVRTARPAPGADRSAQLALTLRTVRGQFATMTTALEVAMHERDTLRNALAALAREVELAGNTP